MSLHKSAITVFQFMTGKTGNLFTTKDFFRLSRFCAVGIFTFLFYYSVLIGLVEHIGTGISTASAIAYLLAVSLNYLLHYFWTFGSDSSHKTALARYITMILSGFVINLFCMTFIVPNDGSYYIVIQSVVLICIVLWNFILSHYWVFK